MTQVSAGRWHFAKQAVCLAVLGTALSSCGGDNAGNPAAAASTGQDTAKAVAPYPDLPTYPDVPTANAASRFLTQTTFGPTAASIDELKSMGFAKWFDTQVAKPQSLLQPLIENIETIAQKGSKNFIITGITDVGGFNNVWWTQVTKADDQLKQRVAFAYSQIFVVSMQPDSIKYEGISIANYYDTLGRDAFVNYRQLLEDVALHATMGSYLNWRRNTKEIADASGNIVRTPDENFAREVMQLFTIGQVQLNLDGTPKLDSSGNTIPAYTQNDIFGIAKAMTGWDARATGGPYTVQTPMRPLNISQHSPSRKDFLGVSIPPAPATADTMKAELKVVLDTLYNHPNVGPFVSKQLIQRLITSNPSPAYVQRVASVFNDNGAGVRGDMKAVIRAIVMDFEAHDVSRISDAKFGKLREPVIRMTNFLRAFNGKPESGSLVMRIGAQSNPANGLNQAAMNAPSVFNFYRPGYVPPNTSLGGSDLLAPEMQITDTQSIIGYLNFMRDTISGNNSMHIVVDYSAVAPLVEDNTIDQLFDNLNLLLMEGQMPSGVRDLAKNAVLSIKLVDAASTPAGQRARSRRLWTAINLLMSSNAYVVQK